MCHSPVLRHGDGSAVHSVLRVQGDADWARRGCVAPRQAESEVLVGSKEGAKEVVGEFGNFLADDGEEEADDIMKLSAFTLLGPDPGVTMLYAKGVVREQPHSLRPRLKAGLRSYALIPARRSVAGA